MLQPSARVVTTQTTKAGRRHGFIGTLRLLFLEAVGRNDGVKGDAVRYAVWLRSSVTETDPEDLRDSELSRKQTALPVRTHKDVWKRSHRLSPLTKIGKRTPIVHMIMKGYHDEVSEVEHLEGSPSRWQAVDPSFE
jgi:hypothetical protein